MAVSPRRILLATDLSARSDRAQDRAVSLAKQYHSELLALHVIEPTQMHMATRRIRFSPFFNAEEKLIENAISQMREYLRDIGQPIKVRIDKGEPNHIILKVAREEQCDLIVSGVARNEMLGRITLGKTVDRLMRDSKIPLLIVTERVRAPYQNIVVACDFSDISRHALETAAAFFPDQKITILHAHAAPGSWAVDNVEDHREQMRRLAYREYLAFLDTVDLSDRQRRQLNLLIEWGDPARLLQELVQRTAVDLVVVGSQVRGVVLNALFGSVARRIVSAWCCDALVVRGPLLSKGPDL